VAGHAGRLVLGSIRGVPVAVLSGRAHFYEGHGMEVVTFPIRVLAELGIRDLLLTNAAGGINSHFRPGDFMVLRDHINFMGVNALRGESTPGRDRFVDMSQVYDTGLRAMLKAAGKNIGLALKDGVYVAVPGPCYETPAEIRAFALLGADAVGMSTVPEAAVGRHCKLRVAALSCITNLAAGRSKRPISHEEVLATGKQVAESAVQLLLEFAAIYAKHQ
jgi:purine-nucleoside phosphorylase